MYQRLMSSFFILLLCVFSSSSFAAHPSDQEINFGVLSLSSPSTIYKNWKPFADYLAQKSGLKVHIIAPRGFGKLKKMAEDKDVDLFYVNSHIFYRLKQTNKAVAVAQMLNIDGNTTSQSNIFVRNDSNIKEVSQLKGKTLAFVSPMGAGGYLAPRAFLYDQGIKTQTETKEVFTKNIANSVYDVLLGKADAASMCGVNYQLLSKKIDTGELNIIASSQKYPENVLAMRPDLSKDLIIKVKNIILQMSEDERGKKILGQLYKMKIKKFVEYDESIEHLTRNLLKSGEFSD